MAERCRLCGGPVHADGADGHPMHRPADGPMHGDCLDELLGVDPLADVDDEGEPLGGLAPAVCFFCGDVTRSGFFIAYQHCDLPVCNPCVTAFQGGGRLAFRRIWQ